MFVKITFVVATLRLEARPISNWREEEEEDKNQDRRYQSYAHQLRTEKEIRQLFNCQIRILFFPDVPLD